MFGVMVWGAWDVELRRRETCVCSFVLVGMGEVSDTDSASLYVGRKCCVLVVRVSKDSVEW